MMTNEGSSKIVTFMIPGAGVWSYKSYSEIVLSSIFSTSNAVISIVERDYNAVSYTIVDFYLFYDGAVDIIYKYEPF